MCLWHYMYAFRRKDAITDVNVRSLNFCLDSCLMVSNDDSTTTAMIFGDNRHSGLVESWEPNILIYI